MHATTPTLTCGTRRPVRLGALAFAGLALVGTGLGVAAAPAQAASAADLPADWDSRVVVPRGDGQSWWAGGTCGKGTHATEAEVALTKLDQFGQPIPGVTFSVEASPSYPYASDFISASSWEDARSVDLEEARIAAQATQDELVATRDELLAVLHPLAAAVTDAQLRVDAAQAQVDEVRADLDAATDQAEVDRLTAELEAAEAVLATDQATLADAQAADAPVRAEYDVAAAAVRAQQEITHAAVVAIGEHLQNSGGEYNSWSFTTDATGQVDETILGCGGVEITVTEVSVPEGVLPDGIGSAITIGADGTVTGADGSAVYTDVQVEQAVGDDFVNRTSITISAENEVIPPVTPTPTPEQPTPTPEVPVTPTPTPEQPTPTTVQVTPAPQAPSAAKPVVSG